MATVDVAIIGAGPFGLALAAHLHERRVEHRIFGAPMQAWASMSPGMCLKSFGFATSIPTPGWQETLPDYCRERDLEDWEPIEIATFTRYGIHVQRKLIPQLEPHDVTYLDHDADRFDLTLASGERLHARSVVVATGLTHFEYIPAAIAALPPSLVSHTAAHGDFSPFAGRDVTVVGAGQSALQAAALLHEHGARTRLLAREDVGWSDQMQRQRPLRERLRRPNSVLGPGRRNFVLEHAPMLVHYLPDSKRLPFTHSHLGPLGAWWLRPRVEGLLEVRQHTIVRHAEPSGDKVRLRVTENGGSESDILTDHVIAGTGYLVDVDKLAFLSPRVRARIARVERSPALSRHFESSLAGLYFVGPSAALSFGPLFRFVAGAYYAVPLLSRRLSSRHGSWRSALKRRFARAPQP